MEQFSDETNAMSWLEQEISDILFGVGKVRFDTNVGIILEIGMALKLVSNQQYGVNSYTRKHLGEIGDTLLKGIKDEYPTLKTSIDSGPERFFYNTMSDDEREAFIAQLSVIDGISDYHKQQQRGTGR